MRFAVTLSMIVTTLLLTASLLGGCEQAIFAERGAHSPYDRYMTLRGRQHMARSTNKQVAESPALRERLKPLGAP